MDVENTRFPILGMFLQQCLAGKGRKHILNIFNMEYVKIKKIVKKEDREYIQMCMFIYLYYIFMDNVTLLKKIPFKFTLFESW